MIKGQRAALVLTAGDDVAVALRDLAQGEELEPEGVRLGQAVPMGHKIALRAKGAGDALRKYGQIIGFAREEIQAGDWVHTHNLAMGDFARDYAAGSEYRPIKAWQGQGRTFRGYVRADGGVGTRNYLLVLPTVACANTVAKLVARAVQPESLAAFPAVDGVMSLSHGLGCGMSLPGLGLKLLQRVLAGYARNPNVAGVLLVGLGCEVNQLDSLMGNMDLSQGPLLRTLNVQELGGTRATVAAGLKILGEMLPAAGACAREELPASRLKLGLQCGGSDAWSGVTANPALGAAVDMLAAQGGTAILAETPEIYGAEHLLTRRAASPEVAQRLLERIHWWEDYTKLHGGTMDNNPSPGNKAGGLTTILEKSLGAAAKGGTTGLMEVYEYAQPVSQPGMVFMDTPGHDLISITGLVAGGANLVCFTTGRGSVVGTKPAPVIKLATNSVMYERMAEDMDLNCGVILEGKATVEEMGTRIFELMLKVASGQASKSEELGFGDEEFLPWQVGEIM